MELENKLAAYRAKKNREEKINHLKESLKKIIPWNKYKKDDKETNKEQQEPLIDDDITEKETNIPNKQEETKLENKTQSNKALKIAIYITGFLTWSSLYYFFIKLQFGIIYLIISALLGIYFNTRTGPKDENEVSAYSVFNKNCESIDGTLKAEQFEREIRFGGL